LVRPSDRPSVPFRPFLRLTDVPHASESIRHHDEKVDDDGVDVVVDDGVGERSIREEVGDDEEEDSLEDERKVFLLETALGANGIHLLLLR